MSEAMDGRALAKGRFAPRKRRRRPGKAPRLRRKPSRYLSEDQWLAVAVALDLSPRQLDIARLVFDGLNEPTISRKLGLSTGTVHTYLHRTYNKLDVHNRGDLVARIFVAYLANQPPNDRS